MAYRLMGRTHAWLLGLRDDRGQGTVEYVGLILLIAAVIAGVVAVGSTLKGGGIAQTVVEKLKAAIEGAGKK
jgi:Flp pilus assembly pilin Flp